MIARPLPPLEELKEFLDYNPDTGIFTWKKQVAPNIKVGQKAGVMHSWTYYIIITFIAIYLHYSLLCSISHEAPYNSAGCVESFLNVACA